MKKDCPSPLTDSEASRIKSGLSSVDWDKLSALIKTKVAALPERSSIPDEPTLTIELNGVIVSKYCRHCGRYTKSKGIHSTSEHKGHKFAYVPPVASGNAGAPAPAPATQQLPVSASLAHVSPLGPLLLLTCPFVKVCPLLQDPCSALLQTLLMTLATWTLVPATLLVVTSLLSLTPIRTLSCLSLEDSLIRR